MCVDMYDTTQEGRSSVCGVPCVREVEPTEGPVLTVWRCFREHTTAACSDVFGGWDVGVQEEKKYTGEHRSLRSRAVLQCNL